MALTALQQLLASLPAPAKPLPLGLNVQQPPLLAPPGPPPDLPPTAPAQPIDMGFVDRYAGAAPVAPVERRPGKLEQIAAVLSGVALGPQYGMALREQREQPFRDYQRQSEQYQDRRARGLEIAERRAERQQEAIQRQADERADREFKVWLQRTGVQDQRAIEQLQQAHELEKQARAFRNEQAKELQREQREREADAKVRTGRFFTATKNMALSTELGRYYAGLSDKPLSPAAARLDAQIAGAADDRMRRAAGGGGRSGPSNAAMRALANFNGALQEVIGASQRGDVRGERLARRKMDAMHGRLSQFPRDIEAGIGTGGWPYAKLRGQAAPAPAGTQQQQFNLNQPQASPARAQAKQKLMAVGYSDQEAEAELNRLGIN